MSRSALPVRKVGAAGLGGAVSTALIWALLYLAPLLLVLLTPLAALIWLARLWIRRRAKDRE